MSDAEQDLVAAVRRHAARARALDQATTERDDAIRRAVAANVQRRRIVEISGLSPQRVDQIRRSARI